MPDAAAHLLGQLAQRRTLSVEQYAQLIAGHTEELALLAAQMAQAARRQTYGDVVFVRGLIEVSNVCANDCYYCGIRRSNSRCERYTLTREQVLACCAVGHALGFRTFVLQGGESSAFSVPAICELVRAIKQAHPDCAVTLSLGEYPREAYEAMRRAGADRYLLRHETANEALYASLHPENLTLRNRLRCLDDLKALGFQAGCGFMVGTPGQTIRMLAEDLKYVETFSPAMCGIGPFIPHRDTPLAGAPAGSAGLTTFLLSLLRLMHPGLLLPATTALSSMAPDGTRQGILAGANVVMPNLSPPEERVKYTLYDHKAISGAEAAENLQQLSALVASAGCRLVFDRGDHIPCQSFPLTESSF